MAYDLEEQEQLETLKAWWKQYGNFVTWLLIIALTAYVGWTLWNVRQRDQSQQASQLYENLKKASVEKDTAKVKLAAAQLTEKFSGTAYASIGALSVAKIAFETNDLKTAKQQLQWVLDNSSSPEFKAIARLRLAGISLDEKAYDTALALLSDEFPSEFVGDAAERKGDVLVAQNKIVEARSAYQTALEKMKANNPGRSLIQTKLDAVGGASDSKSVAKNSDATSK